MKACEEYEELLGAALAGDLSGDAETQLHEHLDECDACARELESLQHALNAIPADSVDLPESLRPAIEQDIRAAQARRLRLRAATGIAAAAAIAVVAALGSSLVYTPDESPEGVFVAETVQGLPAAYTELIEAEEYPKAFVWLQNAISETPEHFDTPANHAQLAALAYEHLQWYPEAYAAYQNYRASHPEAFSASSDDVQRFAILDEAHALDADFASLHDWNRVQHERDVAEYAAYIERYPGTLYASDAVVQIASLAAEEFGAETEFTEAAETALARLENPVVVAQFKLELGRHYLHEIEDPDAALRLLQDVESSPVTALAMAARKSLDDLRDK